MSDLIDRQAAIDAMMALKAEDDEMYGCSIPESFDGERAVEALRKLPSAERKKGKWITVYMTLANNQNGHITEYECNKCNEHQIVKSNFCPNCGADMRGEE